MAFKPYPRTAEVGSLISAFYAPAAASGVRHDDPAFAVDWSLPVSVISETDRTWPDFLDPSGHRRHPIATSMVPQCRVGEQQMRCDPSKGSRTTGQTRPFQDNPSAYGSTCLPKILSSGEDGADARRAEAPKRIACTPSLPEFAPCLRRGEISGEIGKWRGVMDTVRARTCMSQSISIDVRAQLRRRIPRDLLPLRSLA